MTVSAFRELITPASVREAWGNFWRDSRKQKSAGIDGITPADYLRDLERNLYILCRLLREGYRFSLLKGHPIPKPGGKTRIICVPTVQDRIVQRLLAEYLMRHCKELGIINDVSFGFIKSEQAGERRGLSAARDRAAQLRSQHPWAYKSDISSFFDRIPREEVVQQTIRTLNKPSFRAILNSAVQCEIDVRDEAIARIVESNGIVPGLGVRQGMPLSPLFANIILRDFDQEMIRRGVKLVRYADDFIAFAQSASECRRIDEIARELLGRLGFTLPPLADCGSKTFIAAPEIDIDFLGLALTHQKDGTYKLVITKDQLDKISRDLGNMISIDGLLKQNLDITTMGKKIDDKIGGYRAAYSCAHNADDLDKLLKKFRSSALRTVYVSAFGEQAVQKLSFKHRRFLGLEPPPDGTTQPKPKKLQNAPSRGGKVTAIGSSAIPQVIQSSIELPQEVAASGGLSKQRKRRQRKVTRNPADVPSPPVIVEATTP